MLTNADRSFAVALPLPQWRNGVGGTKRIVAVRLEVIGWIAEAYCPVKKTCCS